MAALVNKNYPINVWLISNTVAALLFLATYFVHPGGRVSVEAIVVPLFYIIFGTGLSVPAYCLFKLAFKDITAYELHPIATKAILIFVAIVLLYFTVALLYYWVSNEIFLIDYSYDQLYFFLNHSFAITICGFGVRLKQTSSLQKE